MFRLIQCKLYQTGKKRVIVRWKATVCVFNHSVCSWSPTCVDLWLHHERSSGCKNCIMCLVWILLAVAAVSYTVTDCTESRPTWDTKTNMRNEAAKLIIRSSTLGITAAYRKRQLVMWTTSHWLLYALNYSETHLPWRWLIRWNGVVLCGSNASGLYRAGAPDLRSNLRFITHIAIQDGRKRISYTTILFKLYPIFKILSLIYSAVNLQ